ncbi:MAG TPA: response regulator [Motilibacteraceae bacterium]|nr:response regulator [Motilibacteraceae bacterium]
MSGDVQVLVVEDEPLVAEAHATYVRRVPGFEVAGVVNGGRDALRVVRDRPVDVLLLDFNLPDLHGLEVCRALRAGGVPVDVIAVTSARDLASVRAAVSVGVVQYLLKPFTFASLRDKLERYAAYRDQVQSGGQAAGQGEVDRALASLRGVSTGTLPSGLSAETLEAVARALQDEPGALSAAQVATRCGISRVTARRYLEHLAESGTAVRRQRYGRTGRPEVEYAWTAR